jgi:hypothetical protein
LEKIESEQKRSLKKVDDIYEKQQNGKHVRGGDLLFV